MEQDVCPLLVAHPTDAELVYHARGGCYFVGYVLRLSPPAITTVL
jgi:hypothetical protein